MQGHRADPVVFLFVEMHQRAPRLPAVGRFIDRRPGPVADPQVSPVLSDHDARDRDGRRFQLAPGRAAVRGHKQPPAPRRGIGRALVVGVDGQRVDRGKGQRPADLAPRLPPVAAGIDAAPLAHHPGIDVLSAWRDCE